MTRLIRVIAAVILGATVTVGATDLPYSGPSILPLRARKPVVEDPIFRALMPEDPWAVRRLGMLVFFDRGAQGVERLLIAHHAKDFYTKDWDEGKENQWEALARVVRVRNPKRIAIDQAVKIPYGDGLTAGLKQRLVTAIGPELAARLTPAEELPVAVLERRMPEEMALYDQIVGIAHEIIREAFSSRVITPEITTLDDLDWWFNQRVVDLGLERWFFNDTTLIRPTATGPKDRVIRRGDVVHCDIGLRYLGLHTDTQELAYVLREGETGAPAGLVEGLKQGNRMQDILIGEFRLGRTGMPREPSWAYPTIRTVCRRKANTRFTPTRRMRSNSVSRCRFRTGADRRCS